MSFFCEEPGRTTSRGRSSLACLRRLSSAPYWPRLLGGQGQFIVNTDGNEIAAFGGPFPFYSFNLSNGLTYNSSETITLGMNYFLDSNTGMRSIIYSANGVNSPILAFSNTEQGIMIGDTTLGGYFQISNDQNNPLNSGSAAFGDISIVPGPSTFALLSMGIVTLGAVVSRRRRM